jgi:6-phosphogluconolactonase (cycloisomerase 2 family)
MKSSRLHILSFALLLAGVGCGGGSAPKIITVPPVASCTPSSNPEFAYVLNDGDNTVSMYTVNSCTGDLSPMTPATVATGANNFGSEGLAVDPSGRFAYVANLMSNASDLATVAMFTIDPSTGVLSPTTPPTVATGFFPQGIGIDPLARFVYTANSDDNSVSMFTVNASTGILTPTTPPAVSTLANVSTGNESSPLAVTVDPSGRFAYAVNEDDGTVSMFTIDSTTGILMPTTPATVFTGPIPFGITVDPSGKFAYVVNNESGVSMPFGISQYTVDSVTGVLTENTPSVVGAGNGPTSVAVDPTSKFAYVVNRQDNTVSMFTIDSSTGNLTPNTPTIIATGKQPFCVAVDPSGKFVYVTNQNSNSVSIYTINANGTLTAAGTAATGNDPIWMAVIGPVQ